MIFQKDKPKAEVVLAVGQVTEAEFVRPVGADGFTTWSVDGDAVAVEPASQSDSAILVAKATGKARVLVSCDQVAGDRRSQFLDVIEVTVVAEPDAVLPGAYVSAPKLSPAPAPEPAPVDEE